MVKLHLPRPVCALACGVEYTPLSDMQNCVLLVHHIAYMTKIVVKCYLSCVPIKTGQC